MPAGSQATLGLRACLFFTAVAAAQLSSARASSAPTFHSQGGICYRHLCQRQNQPFLRLHQQVKVGWR